MKYRVLGKTGIECSILGLGTGRLASLASNISAADASRVISLALDAGINVIDTSDSYGRGASEKLLGRSLGKRRDKVVLITKAGYEFSGVAHLSRIAGAVARGVFTHIRNPRKKLMSQIADARMTGQNFSPAYIRRAIDASLSRLCTDRIDIFLLHSPTLAAVNDEAVLQVLCDAKLAGKIRHFGVSASDPAVLEKASCVPDFAVMEGPVSPRSPEILPMLPKLESCGVGIVANQIFHSGKLLKEVEPSSIALRIATVAAERGLSPARLLVQFALAQPGITTALTGTTRPERLASNIEDALAPGTISDAELRRIFS